mmetsp:Transcript_54330/g.115980  ORF Transcript_54330/g.115980 Transcript_54330/m.115980 type:complete len:103 (-) Transcript_54330:149-457(-)
MHTSIALHPTTFWRRSTTPFKRLWITLRSKSGCSGSPSSPLEDEALAHHRPSNFVAIVNVTLRSFEDGLLVAGIVKNVPTLGAMGLSLLAWGSLLAASQAST